MDIFITGAGGYIGGSIALHLMQSVKNEMPGIAVSDKGDKLA